MIHSQCSLKYWKLSPYTASHYGEDTVCFLGRFFSPGFLEGTQVSSRWQEDETQRQPGESLEGEPGSSRSQVLSWSVLHKRGDGLLHMLFTAMPNRNKVPTRLPSLSLKGIENGWGTAQNSSTVLKVEIVHFFILPYGKYKGGTFLMSQFRNRFQIQDTKYLIWLINQDMKSFAQ